MALVDLLPRLVPLYPVPIIIAQHSGRASLLPDLLRLNCGIDAKWIRDGEQPQAGQIHLVPPGYQLEVTAGGMKLDSLQSGPSSWLPSIDVFLHSLSRTYASGAVGVVLSGMLPAGLSGLRAIDKGGGVTIAQHCEGARCSQMPSAAADLAKAHLILKPASIAQALNAMTDRWTAPHAAA